MRPPRRDIAAPPFPAQTEWVGGPRPQLERLTAAGPVLVHFYDFAQLNSIRALPYLRAWDSRYRPHGLSLLGVHSPRFLFTRNAAEVEAALPRLEIDWPVAVDSELAIWRAYGCHGWPSLFLWSRGGALRWYHLGEGEYEATEEAIRESLESRPEGGWPPLMDPLRPGDAAGETVIAPTPEILPGGSLEQPWQAAPGRPPLRVEYEAGGVYAAVDGEGELLAGLDGAEPEPIPVPHPGLHRIADHGRHQRHRLELGASPSLRVHSLQFSPAPPS